MYKRYQGENLYKTRLVNKINPISATGDPLDVFTFTVDDTPVNNTGWVIVNFTDPSKRDLIFYHANNNGVLSYYRKDRDLLGTGAAAQTHKKSSFVQMNDVAQWLNYLFTQSDDFGYVADMGVNKVQVRGGLAYYNKTQNIILDTMLTLSDGINYIVLDFTDDSFKAVTIVDYTSHLLLSKVTVVSSDITEIVDNRGQDLHKNKTVIDGLTDVGGNLLYNGVPLGGGVGTGDVVGPSSAVDGNIVEMDGVSGKAIKDSGKSTETSITDSDTKIPTSGAVVDYVSTEIENNSSSLKDKTYYPGEVADRGDIMFVEDETSFVSGNTGNFAQNLSTNGSAYTKVGTKIHINKAGVVVTKFYCSGCTQTNCYVEDSSHNIIETMVISGGVAIPSNPIALAQGAVYYITYYSSGSSENIKRGYPGVVETTPLNFIGGWTSSGGETTEHFGLTSVDLKYENMNEQNIGDISANTRVSRPVFGSGVAGSTIKLALSKTGSPSIDLGIRIETDDNGSPSGTLADANATATISATNILTNAEKLSIQTITQSGGSANYAGTASWSSLGTFTIGNFDMNNLVVTVDAYGNSFRIKNSNGDILETVTRSGGTVTFTIQLEPNNTYEIEQDYGNTYYYTGGTWTTNSFYTLNNTNTSSCRINGLSMSVVDKPIIINLAGSITLTEGQKYHIVAYQGTYGSETVNASNYYSIGYGTDNTTTRGIKLWDGTYWNMLNTPDGIDVDRDFGVVLNNSTSFGGTSGIVYEPTTTTYLSKLTKKSVDLSTSVIIKKGTLSGTTLGSVNFVGDVATFSTPILMEVGEKYYFLADAGGTARAVRRKLSSTPLATYNGNITDGIYNGSDGHNDIYTFVSMTTQDNIIVNGPADTNKRIYTSSDLFTDKLLSKTSAVFSYKTDRLGSPTEDVVIGTKPSLVIDGVDSNQVGMTYGDTMYLSDTPGAISNTAGTNSTIVGRAISATKLMLKNTFNR